MIAYSELNGLVSSKVCLLALVVACVGPTDAYLDQLSFHPWHIKIMKTTRMLKIAEGYFACAILLLVNQVVGAASAKRIERRMRNQGAYDGVNLLPCFESDSAKGVSRGAHRCDSEKILRPAT